jgi:hypothetical protein
MRRERNPACDGEIISLKQYESPVYADGYSDISEISQFLTTHLVHEKQNK